jgi:hypothetical protein
VSPYIIPGASILVALISAAVLVIVKRTRGPVAIQDLWDENRQLRKDLDAVSRKVDGLISDRENQLTVNRIMGEGFDALSAVVERTTAETGIAPAFTPQEHAAVERARALRSDDELWNTLQRSTPRPQGDPA